MIRSACDPDAGKRVSWLRLYAARIGVCSLTSSFSPSLLTHMSLTPSHHSCWAPCSVDVAVVAASRFASDNFANWEVDSPSFIATFDSLRRAQLISASNTLASTLWDLLPHPRKRSLHTYQLLHPLRKSSLDTKTILKICDVLQKQLPILHSFYLNWLVHFVKRKWLLSSESRAEAKRDLYTRISNFGPLQGQASYFGIISPGHSFHTRPTPSSWSCWIPVREPFSLVIPLCQDESILGDCAVMSDGAGLSWGDTSAATWLWIQTSLLFSQRNQETGSQHDSAC